MNLDKIRAVLQRKDVLLGLASAVSFSAGAASSYIFTKKKFEAFADQEIAEYKAGYKELNDRAREIALENEKQKIDLSEYQNRLEDLDYTQIEEKVTPTAEKEEPVKAKTTRRRPSSQWDQEAEEAERTRDKPYIISADEYFAGEEGYQQATLTYFEEDDVLGDTHDTHISNIEEIVGSDNLRFGHGSGEENIVYIRNDRLDMDYEVVLEKGSFAETVHGIIEHSDKRHRKFRHYDE